MSVDCTTTTCFVDYVATLAHIRHEIAIWNYGEASTLATQVENQLASGSSIESFVLSGILILLARVYINRAETQQSPSKHFAEKAKALLAKAAPLIVGDSERLAEVAALTASLKNLEKGPDTALALLDGRLDPYAVRVRIALLLKQQKIADALGIVDGLELHEHWCDVAVTIYALNDQIDKAQSIVRWVANLPDRSRYTQCVVRLAEAMMSRSLIGQTKGINIMPHDITPQECDKLEAVAETLCPVLQPIQAAGKPNSELDVAALRIAWQANHLLQRREMVTELMALMSQWTPIPLDVARGVVSGYIQAAPELPDRLRQDHSGDLDAGILAAVIQSGFLGQPKEAFAQAKELLPLATSNEKKEELFRLFQQVWQNIEGAEVAECETIAGSLVTHNSRLQGMFEAAVALRNGEADRAIGILDRQKSEDDVYWLQLKSNALLLKRQLPEAVDFLLPAAKKTADVGLLHKTADLAYQAKKFDISVWCYERLAAIQPENADVRGRLAHLYTFILHDIEKAAVQFRALHKIEPGNLVHASNLAICLAQLDLPQESFQLYDDLCAQASPTIQIVLGRAQLYHSLGQPAEALTSLIPFREKFWNDPAFLMAFMNTAYASGDEDAAHDAMKALNLLQAAGKVEPQAFRAVQKDEVLEMFKQTRQQTQDRTELMHAEMLKGRMPWVWAEQMSNNPIYMGWRTRTQEMGWIGDDPANRARLCIYSTNSFHARETEMGRRELLPLECPAPGTTVVADISSLITLHRLGLLDAAAEYFGEVLVPAGYLPTVLEDSRQMVLNQRSRQKTAEQIIKWVNAGRIVILTDGVKPPNAIVDEHGDDAAHRYRLIDIISPLRDAGKIADEAFDRIKLVCFKASTVDETHPIPGHFQDVVVGTSTLETLAQFGLLDSVTAYFKVHIQWPEYRELLGRLESIACQEETREWHLSLWNQLRSDSRFRFIPHIVPEEMRRENSDEKDYLPFFASFIAQKTSSPLLADDRVCQALRLNEMPDNALAAFGTDVLVMKLLAEEKLASGKATATIRQLMAWRYRFLIPSPEILKLLADQYRGSPPGLALQDVAEYVQDCMRDPGLFGGAENTTIGESMAGRAYLTWSRTIAEFLILVWADEGFTPEAATQLTKWSAHELLPSLPRVLDGQAKVRMSLLTPRLFLSHALLKTASQFGNPRMADAMKAMKEALHLNDDEYTRIVTEILNDTARTKS